MATSEFVCAVIQEITIIIAEEIRKIIEKKKNRRPRRWWVRPWIQRRYLFGDAQLLVELAEQDPETYQKHLRMSEAQFSDLLIKVGPFIQRSDTCLRAALPAKVKLHITLHYLATGSSFNTLSALYRVPVCSISLIIPEVCEIIYNVLQEFIQVPTSVQEWKTIMNEYKVTWNFPNCCGAIDGKHIVIRSPPNSGSDYFNYKKTFSIILLAIVDANYNFLYIDVGTNGRNNDACVFANSTFNEALEKNLLNIPENGLFVADDAFPLRPNLLKPYPRPGLNKTKLVFNYRLSRARRARRIVENAFGILVARFRIFEKPIPLCTNTVEKVVKATCALHNWLRKTSNTTNPYLQSDLMDSEDWNQGKVIPGKWRSLRSDGMTEVLKALSTNNHKKYAAEVRDAYANQFVTTDIVPWQWNMI